VVVLDDAHELCAGLNLRKDIDSILGLGRSAVVSCVVASGDTAYVPRGQLSFKWIGHLDGLPAGKAAAGVLGQRGVGWAGTLLATPPFGWVYADDRPGSPARAASPPKSQPSPAYP
jgi:hypothetical protein